MDRERLDALAFMSGALIKFASNWSLDVSSFERPTLLILPREGQPFGILHELSTNSWRFAADAGGVWVPNVFFYSEHPRLRNRLPLSPQWNAMVASHLERAGLATCSHWRGWRGGCADWRGDARTSLCAAAVAATPAPECRGSDAADLFTVKHEEEIALIREAASLANWGAGALA